MGTPTVTPFYHPEDAYYDVAGSAAPDLLDPEPNPKEETR